MAKKIRDFKSKKAKGLKRSILLYFNTFFIDFVNGKKWKLNNKYLKNITSKDNVSEFFNTLQELSQNVNEQKEYLSLSVDLLRIIFPSLEEENKSDDKNLDEGKDEEDSSAHFARRPARSRGKRSNDRQYNQCLDPPAPDQYRRRR